MTNNSYLDRLAALEQEEKARNSEKQAAIQDAKRRQEQAQAASMASQAKVNDLYARLEATENDTERKILFLDAMRRTAEDEGCPPPVLVGGSAVELYSMGGYASLDMDLTGDENFIARFARSLGLENDVMYPNVFFSKEKNLILDLRGKLDIDGAEERKRALNLGDNLTVVVISLEDIVVDRLVGYKWGGHHPSRHIAELLIRVNQGSIDTELLRQIAGNEDVSAELEEIMGCYPKLRQDGRPIDTGR